jgi:hypothetical protein
MELLSRFEMMDPDFQWLIKREFSNVFIEPIHPANEMVAKALDLAFQSLMLSCAHMVGE